MGSWMRAATRRHSAPHRYETCNDDFCERYVCRVFQQGVLEGIARAHQGGGSAVAQAYAEGKSDGYAEGKSDAQADAENGGDEA